MKFVHRGDARSGFSLVELLVVITIIVAIGGLSVTALHSLKGAGGIRQASSSLSGFLEAAQAHAMANNTIVRIAIFEDNNPANTISDGITVLAIVPADGTLQNNDMSDITAWPSIGKPLIFSGVTFDDTLNISSSGNPVTTTDPRPSQSDLLSTSVSRNISGVSRTITGMLQIQPSGEFRVDEDTPSRSITIGMLNINDASQKNNPVIVKVSGYTGSISILRKEDGIE